MHGSEPSCPSVASGCTYDCGRCTWLLADPKFGYAVWSAPPLHSVLQLPGNGDDTLGAGNAGKMGVAGSYGGMSVAGSAGGGVVGCSDASRVGLCCAGGKAGTGAVVTGCIGCCA